MIFTCKLANRYSLGIANDHPRVLIYIAADIQISGPSSEVTSVSAAQTEDLCRETQFMDSQQEGKVTFY